MLERNRRSVSHLAAAITLEKASLQALASGIKIHLREMPGAAAAAFAAIQASSGDRREWQDTDEDKACPFLLATSFAQFAYPELEK